eukprot:353711-Chlamydomonas_euryale.AAC.4
MVYACVERSKTGDQTAGWAPPQRDRRCGGPKTPHPPLPRQKGHENQAQSNDSPFPTWSMACRPPHPAVPALQQTKAAQPFLYHMIKK